MSLQKEHAVDVLKKFIKEMNRWEKDCNRSLSLERKGLLSYEQNYETNKKKLEDIFAKYCLSSVPERSVSYSQPPEYNPEGEPIIDALLTSENRILITTQQLTGFKFRLTYEMLKKNEEWYINKRKIVDPSGELEDEELEL